MTRPTTKIAASLAVALAAGLAWSAPAAADPLQWAPAHGWREKHHRGPVYVYPYAVYPRRPVLIVPPPAYYAPPPAYYYPPPVYFPPVTFSATIRGW